MALAGDEEVVVAIQAQLDRAANLARRHGGPHGQVAGLRLLAAEAAAHAAAFHAHGVVVHGQRVRHPVLHLARVLGAGVDEPLPLLLRQRVGDLALEVKMLLPAHLQLAAQAVRRARQRRRGIAAAHEDWGQHVVLLRQRLLHVQHCGQRRGVGAHQARGAARLLDAVGHHQADDLAGVLHTVDGEHRLVVGEGREQLVARNVGRQHHAAYAGQLQRGGRVDAVQVSMGDAREDGGRVQRAAYLGQVVDVAGAARYLGTGALVRVRLAHGGLGVCRGGHGGGRACHAASSCGAQSASEKSSSETAVWPWLSSQ